MASSFIIRKRKWGDSLNDTDGNRRIKLNKVYPATDPIEKQIEDEENSPFPTDLITSDPTFFDDYIPREDIPPTPATSLPSSPPLRPSAQLAEDINPDSRLSTHSDLKSNVSPTTSRAMKQQQYGQDLAQEEEATDVRDQGRVQPTNVDHDSLQLEEEASQQQDNRISKVATTTKSRRDPQSSISNTLRSRTIPRPVLEGSGQRSDSETTGRTQPSDNASSSVFDIPSDSDAVQPSRRSLTKPSQTVTSRLKRVHSSTITAPNSKKPSRSGKVGLAFDISPIALPNHVYTVQDSQAGLDWQKVARQSAYYEKITEDVKLKYIAGDIVRLDFVEGPGGHGKIIEMRGDKIQGGDKFFLVVQWLYSRSDATRLKGKLPPLERWPKNTYMLTDHFQVVGDENIEGASSLKPIDGVYWQIGSRSLQSLAELDQQLERQLQSLAAL